MATGKITQRAVDAANPGDRDVYLWDGELRGFGLKVTPAGGRSYLVQYRVGGRRGRTRRVTIGKHGSPWTAHTAREEAKRLLGEVAAGADPAEGRTQARKDKTMAELCDEYLAEAEVGRVLTRFGEPKKASTLATDCGRIERHIKPLLGRRTVRSITQTDVKRFMADVRAGKTAADVKTGRHGRAIVQGGRGTASRTVGLLGGIFTFAMDQGLRQDNPVRGVKRAPDRKNKRYLSPQELARLGAALSEAEREGENPHAINAIRLLIMTGCRKGEILSLKSGYIDWDMAYLRLPASKTGQKDVPIGAPALELLASLPRYEGSGYVFPAASGEGHYVGLPKVWHRIRERAGLSDVRLHDLRHSFASFGVAGGDSLPIIGALLGHRDAATTQRYAHLADDVQRAAANRISGRIAAAMNGGQGEVVELPRKA